MERKTEVLIIGGGVAGLAAGCYARMCGFQTLILEQHFLPGGLCTSWERDGYVFDGCISYLYGTAPGMPFNELWQELGLAGYGFIHRDEFIRVRNERGDEAVGWADPDVLYDHLVSIAPEDKKRIRDFTIAVKEFVDIDMSALTRQPRELMGPAAWGKLGLEMLPSVATTARWCRVSASDFAAGFKNPFLKEAIPHLLGWPEIPVLAAASTYAYLWKKNAGFPAGGSLAFARALEQRYLALGGRIEYRKRVERVLVENDRAVGARLYTDEDIRAEFVISAADGRSTVFEMLGGVYGRRSMKRRYGGDLPLHSQMQLSFGVNRDLSGTPAWIIHLLDPPYRLLSEERSVLSVKNFSFDPSLAPEGKSVVEVFLRMDYGYFRRLIGNRLYDSEQDQTAEQVLKVLERVMPGMSKDVEHTDVATPISYERYTGNWNGSSCGWLLTKKTMLSMILGMKKTLPGLDRFYMAGQWVEPGGSVPLCAASGKNAVALLCKDAGKTVPS
ncbi:MAG: NAD(P)/FAD-dependent oxidoreductase [Spirochaetales bacterium]|nr:NAD(P)/FAD-dependent oxidoreductase [Spirochaetales bacterium]